MKSFGKSLLAILLILTLIVPMPFSVMAAENSMPVDKAGVNGGLTWKVTNTVLWITGADFMTDFCINGDTGSSGYMKETSAPWSVYSSKITTVAFDENVKSIGIYAFANFTKLKTVYIGRSLANIYANAFWGCNALSKVNYSWGKSKKDEACSCSIVGTGNESYNNAAVAFDRFYGIKVSYALAGGKNNSQNPTLYNPFKGTVTLKAATKTGFGFAGWYKDSGYTTKITKLTSSDTSNITLYAKWSSNKNYTVKFSANGGKGSMSSIICKIGVSKTLPANKFTKAFYFFSNWNTKKNGSGKRYANKASVKNLTTESGKTITLYAQWKLKSGCYTVSYKLNGGTNNSQNPKVYSKKETVALKNPTRKGYTFLGWYKNSKFTGSKLTKITAGTTGSLLLYAKWAANKYTVKFAANGGSGSMSSKTYTYGKSYTLPANAFKRKGEAFAGWNTKKDGSGTAYKNKASVKNLSSKSGGIVTLYAKWKSNTTDLAELNNALAILARTCEPAHKWFQGSRVSSRVNSSGIPMWSCQTASNSSLSCIKAYDAYGRTIGYTGFSWNAPMLTSSESIATNAYTYKQQIINNEYDFSADPAKALISWGMFTDTIAKSDFQKRINNTVSATVYNEVLKRYNARTTSTYGASCIIIYGKDNAGKLIGKYAGSVYYNLYDNAASYNLVGINPQNTEDYGKIKSGTLVY